MKLHEVTSQYVAYKQSMGMRFRTEARVLKSFCRMIGDVRIDQTEPDIVQAFLAGTGPVTRFWHRKYDVLRGFYRYAIARRYVNVSPLPRTVPKPPPPFVPYIFSRDELQRLLIAAESCLKPRAKMESHTCRTLLLLLYGAGLRISEALALTLADVNLSSGVLIIRESKFYKTRLVPIASDLIRAMDSYQSRRFGNHSAEPTSPFFVDRKGEPLTRQVAERAFRRICLSARISGR